MSAESTTSSGAAGILSGRNKECWEPEASGQCGAAVTVRKSGGLVCAKCSPWQQRRLITSDSAQPRTLWKQTRHGERERGGQKPGATRASVGLWAARTS